MLKNGRLKPYPAFREGVDSHVRRALGDIPALEADLLIARAGSGHSVHSLKSASRVIHAMAKNVEEALLFAERDRDRREKRMRTLQENLELAGLPDPKFKKKHRVFATKSKK